MDKLDDKTFDRVFIGYAHNSRAYRFLVVKSDYNDYSPNTIKESCDAIFFENIFPYKNHIKNVESSTPMLESNYKSDSNNEVALRRSKRPRIEKDFGDDFITFLIEDPLTYAQAMTASDAPLWKEAIKSEMDSILAHETWVLTDLPPGCKPIGCKWIFKKKLNPDGTIDKYKARLVAKGFSQKEGLDYFDTYSPVTRITTIRVLLALTVAYKLEIHQMDVKMAFLNRELEE